MSNETIEGQLLSVLHRCIVKSWEGAQNAGATDEVITGVITSSTKEDQLAALKKFHDSAFIAGGIVTATIINTVASAVEIPPAQKGETIQ